jgi:hypothetical protein
MEGRERKFGNEWLCLLPKFDSKQRVCVGLGLGEQMTLCRGIGIMTTISAVILWLGISLACLSDTDT